MPPVKRARLLARGMGWLGRWAHARPFLATFLALSVWLTILSSVVWIENNHRINDIQELRRDRARLGAESDYKLCLGLNQLKAAIRTVVIDSDQTKRRLGLGHHEHVTVAVLHRVAAGEEVGKQRSRRVRVPASTLRARAVYARALLDFVRQFPPEGCHQLPTQRPFH